MKNLRKNGANLRAEKIHLVALDIDGTLLNSAKQVSKTTTAVLAEAKLHTGLHIVLATARPPRSVMEIYDHLKLDTPMINYNGALVYDPPSRRILLHSPLTCETTGKIIELARHIYQDVIVSAEILDKWYTDRTDHEYLTETGRKFRPNVVAPIEEWLNQDITKLLLLGDPKKLVKLGKIINKQFRYQVAVFQTDDCLLQISHPTVSKAQALKVVAGELGVKPSQVMAVGDNANDVGMLQWAGIGVAMGNAVPKVLAVADYITDTHDADGAAKAIHELIIKGLER